MLTRTGRRSAIAIAFLLAGSALGAWPAAGAGAQTTGFRALSGDEARAFRLPGDVALVATFPVAALGLQAERYQQVHGGAKVDGGQLTLLRTGEEVRAVIGAHYPGITATNRVVLTAVAARERVERELGAGGRRLVDLRIDPASGRYAWQVETQRLDERWFHRIDAETGAVLERYDALAHACGSLSAPCGLGREYDGTAGDTTDVKDLAGLTTFNGSAYELRSPSEGGYRRQATYDMENQSARLKPVATDADNEWVAVGRRSPSQQALVDLQFYANATDDYLMEVHGYDWIAAGDASSYNVQSMRLYGHWGRNYNNAFWNGSYAGFGDGDGSRFEEFSGLDVIAHELAHGVTDFTSDLVYQDESGALNESFSDILGNAVEHWADENGREHAASFQPDWVIGEDFYLGEPTGPTAGFRNMGDPEEDTDPDHYSERYTGSDDNGGVHTNSGIPNHAFYLAVNGGLNASCASPSTHDSDHCSDTADTQDNDLHVIALGLGDASAVFFAGFTALQENATMCQARASTEAAAASIADGDAVDEVNATSQAWIAVGLTDGVCSPSVDGSIHLAGLTGSAETRAGNSGWQARVDALVHRDGGTPQGGVTVRGRWTGTGVSSTSSCTTDSTGKCRVAINLRNTTPSVTFAVESLALDGFTYDEEANTVESSVVITKP